MIQKTYLKTKEACKVKFSLEIPGAKSIQIMGLNGDWNTPVKMSKKKAGVFSVEVTLPKNSEHQFKYYVDEANWMNEPEADSQVSDSFGGNNSVLSL